MRLLDNIDGLFKFFKAGKKMKDSIPIGFLGGLMGTIAMDLSNILFKKTGLSEKTYAEYAGSVLLGPFRLLMRKNYLFGQLIHFITGSTLGVPMFNILKKTGKDNYSFKGAAYGTFTWGMLYTLGQRLGVVRSKTHKTRTHLTTLIDNLVYGLVSSATMVFLTDPTVFTQTEQQIGTSVEDQPSIANEIPISNSEATYENELNILH